MVAMKGISQMQESANAELPVPEDSMDKSLKTAACTKPSKNQQDEGVCRVRLIQLCRSRVYVRNSNGGQGSDMRPLDKV